MANEVLGISLALWGGFSICALTVMLAFAYARRAPEWERMAQRVVEEANAMRLLAETGDFNGLAVGVFACVLAVTLVITRWAAKRTHSATESRSGAA